MRYLYANRHRMGAKCSVREYHNTGGNKWAAAHLEPLWIKRHRYHDFKHGSDHDVCTRCNSAFEPRIFVGDMHGGSDVGGCNLFLRLHSYQHDQACCTDNVLGTAKPATVSKEKYEENRLAFVYSRSVHSRSGASYHAARFHNSISLAGYVLGGNKHQCRSSASIYQLHDARIRKPGHLF